MTTVYIREDAILRYHDSCEVAHTAVSRRSDRGWGFRSFVLSWPPMSDRSDAAERAHGSSRRTLSCKLPKLVRSGGDASEK